MLCVFERAAGEIPTAEFVLVDRGDGVIGPKNINRRNIENRYGIK